MAYFCPDDLFSSERLAACSDDAQLHWPRFYLLASPYARFQIDYVKIVRTAYALFKKQPTKEQINGWLDEYHDHFLLFVYDDPETGTLWGQWLTNKEDFRRHATSEDNRSPEPDAKQFERFRRAYVKQQRAKSYRLFTLSKMRQDVSPQKAKTQDHSCTSLLGSGSGIGSGIGSVLAHTRAGARKSSGDESSDDDDSAGADTRVSARTPSGDASVSSSSSHFSSKQKPKRDRARKEKTQ